MRYTDKPKNRNGCVSFIFSLLSRTNPPSHFPVSFTLLLFLLSKAHFDFLMDLDLAMMSACPRAPHCASESKAVAGVPAPEPAGHCRGEQLPGPTGAGLQAQDPTAHLQVCRFSFSVLNFFKHYVK